MTVYLEDIAPGMSRTAERTVTERDIQLFGEATGDMNPVHFDEEYARATLFRGRVAHGLLSVGYISAVLGMELPGPGTIFVSANIAFKAPVRIGDTVRTVCTVKSIGEGRAVTIACQCFVGDTLVVDGEAQVLAPRRPKA
jgi:3-hydroxybutyryl-CoA dehydratase